MVAIRQVMTLCISSWRASLHPENRDYILRNQPTALRAIQRMAKRRHKDAVSAFIAACRR